MKDTKSKFLIYPIARFTIFWDLIIAVCLLYISFVLPVKIAFFNQHKNVFFIYDIVITSIFFIDIVIGFNRVILDKNDNYITNRKIIAKKYLKGWFVIDFICFIPINLIFGWKTTFNHGLKLIKITRVFHLLRCLRLIKILKSLIVKSESKKINEKTLNLSTSKDNFYLQIFLNIFIIHLFTCMLYYIPVEFSPNHNWVKKRGILHLSNTHKYLATLHWVLQTFTTVGFGETPIE